MQQPLNASVITPKVLLFKKDFLGYFIIYLYFKLTQWKSSFATASNQWQIKNQQTSEISQ